MQIDDILSQFDHSIGRFPRTAVREAVARREDLTPALLGVLEAAARDPRPFASEDRMVHIFAMYLLAQFRETRAYPLLVKIFSAPAGVILQAVAAAQAGRNDPCPCGSGKKFKKCCGG